MGVFDSIFLFILCQVDLTGKQPPQPGPAHMAHARSHGSQVISRFPPIHSHLHGAFPPGPASCWPQHWPLHRSRRPRSRRCPAPHTHLQVSAVNNPDKLAVDAVRKALVHLESRTDFFQIQTVYIIHIINGMRVSTSIPVNLKYFSHDPPGSSPAAH